MVVLPKWEMFVWDNLGWWRLPRRGSPVRRMGDSYPALRLVGDTSFDQKAEPYIEHINYGMGASPEEAAANARLIAAAPELLAALIDIVCRYDPSEQGIESPLFTQAKRAINKALNGKPQFPAHDERLERTARFHHE